MERKIFIQTEGSDLNRLNAELTFVNASYWVLENLLWKKRIEKMKFILPNPFSILPITFII